MNDLLLRSLRHERTPRRPIWIMRQAGRYLPEYREVRQKHSFLEVCRDPELAAEVTRQPLRRFALDAAIIFADLMSPIAALGVPFDFAPGPVLEKPLRTADDIAGLPEPDPDAIAPEVIQTLQMLKPEMNGRALLGFTGSPWTLAAYLVEGQGKRDFPTLRAMAAASPELLDDLLGRLSRLVTKYAIEQARAGADAIQLFDTWAGLLSFEDWQRISRPHIESILTALGDAGIPRILFVQNAPHLVDGYADLPAECLAVDWRMDLGEVQRRAAGKAVQGNLDPAILHAGPDATRVAARALLDRVQPVGHIVNLGHGILPQAPIESVEAFIETVHAEEIRHD